MRWTTICAQGETAVNIQWGASSGNIPRAAPAQGAKDGGAFGAHGLVEEAEAPEDAAVGAGVAAIQRVAVVYMAARRDGLIRRGLPGQKCLAPLHAQVVVQLPCNPHPSTPTLCKHKGMVA